MIKGRNIHRDTFSTVTSAPFDLSATGSTGYLYLNTNRDVRINSLSFYYTEGSSADAGKYIYVGIPSDTDYVSDYTSEVSESAGYTKTFDRAALEASTVKAGVPVIITSEGGKTGAGEVIVSINYTVL